MPSANEPAIKQIKFYLDRYKIKEALQIFFHNDTIKLLAKEPDFMWEIIPLICKRLRGLCQYRFRVFEGCERMLCRIAIDENCNPKEVLISFLAEIGQPEHFDDDNVFRAMIRPLQGTLLRMIYPTPRDENYRWVLNVLMRHINDIELPQEYNLEGKKRLSLPNDPSVKRFIEVLPLILGFIEDYYNKSSDYDKLLMPILTESQIDEVLNGELVDDELMNEHGVSLHGDSAEASIIALISLMNKPFTYLDLTSFCVDLRICATKCLNTLLKLLPNLFLPIYKQVFGKIYLSENESSITPTYLQNLNADSVNVLPQTKTGNESVNEIDSIVSLATCSYLYRCELSPAGSMEIVQPFPQIISNEAMLICYMPYVVSLLDRTEILAHEKGLILLSSLLGQLESDSLNQKVLDTFETLGLNGQLFKIMVFSPLCTNRRKAYDGFTTICDLLTYDCKFKLLKSALSDTELRPCVRAACIDQYRKHLRNAHQCPSRYRHLGGHALSEFLDLCITSCLPDSQHTDIIENYELLLATLTMFRYLKLRKASVLHEIEEEYLCGKRLKKAFFDQIRNAIAVTVNEVKLHQSEEAECMDWVLCRLDLVESILVRTCDLYNC